MKELYCITCPTGCRLTAAWNDDELVVEGNGCNRGVDFAKAEMTNPTRSLTTTVRTTFPGVPVLPVRTDGEIPKEKIMEAMKALNNIVISDALDCGDTVLEDLAETGVRVIATGDALVRKELKNTIHSSQMAESDVPPLEDEPEVEAPPLEEDEANEEDAAPQNEEETQQKQKSRPHITRG